MSSLLESEAISCAEKIRHAAVAGAFYPADSKELSRVIDNLLSAVSTKVEGEIIAAISPHAGYEYSGPVAAYTYAALRSRRYRRIVVIAPSHYVAFNYTSVYDGDAYETPLGRIPVDRDFARKLAERNSNIRISEKGHAFTSAGGEHAIEVQLPWLQSVMGQFELVPIVMGSSTYESSRALALALAQLVACESNEQPTLVLASSDLSHYHSYAVAQMLDFKTLEAMKNWDYLSMSRNFSGQVWEACGGAPVVAAMMYAERMGANLAQVLQYKNSGDTAKDRSHVVGYSAAVFVKSTATAEPPEEFTLTEQEKTKLLALARNSVEQMVANHKIYEPEEPAEAALNRESGAFVTITRDGRLRGCVGYTSAVKPLYLTVRDTATLAAMRDVRFVPVSANELPGLSYEISVLSPMRRVTEIEQIEVGRDGLLIKNAEREGLLLPQVPVEHHWERSRFLEEACVKAGLQREAWREEGTDIFRFSAVVFNEANKLSRETASQKSPSLSAV